MKTKSKSVLIAVVLIFIITIIPLITKAQIGFSSGDPDAPLDGGVSILIAAGVGYGIKKANDSKKKKSPDNKP